ncbi:hypothetical protein TeGR_g5329 [Tetraparma gracilis]|uniref:AAA+ ATPase domain-containing protein n=1 Tax=Tetraparma gracilis TaxID=2962635 RepID=A0ABQ6N9W1_9STRA|nr:hypothetical protein TeGR_g5329 [Tetraparma gracilis]
MRLLLLALLAASASLGASSPFLPPPFGLLPRGGSTDAPSSSASSSASSASSSTSSKLPSKKKKSAKAPSKGGPSKPPKAASSPAPAPAADLSQAILSTPASTLPVSPLASLPPSTLLLSPATLASLGLFDGDVAELSSRASRSTLATVGESPDVPDGTVRASPATLRNAGSAKAAKLAVKAADAQFATAALILPYEDSLPPGFDSDVLADYLAPFFRGKFRPITRGDVLPIDGPEGVVDFLVVDCDTAAGASASSAVVVDATSFEPGEPLARPPEDLSSAGYSEIGGADQHLAAVRELVELPLKHPELWTSLGISPPRGVLLTGPPGCGKTELARAVAAETDAYFFVINGPEVISKRAGESETNLRRAFEDAAANAEEYNGAIVFIDELDSIAPRRDKAGGEVEKRIVSQLLTLMDGLSASSRVVVIAATNRPGVIEPALRRPGRFDRELDMGVPDEKGRREILDIKSRDMTLAGDVDLDKIARDSHGYVGADIQQLCMEAALECIREKMPDIDFDRPGIPKAILDSILINATHFDHAAAAVHPSSLRENAVEIPDVKWEDVGGLEDVKRELHETVQYPVEHAEKYMKFGMHPSKGVLFYGPPGCGKTLLAKAIANECGANFISVKGPELLTQWFGESEANVRELFDKARAASPCILMFDEIDSIAKTRGSGTGGASEAGDRVINQILTEIDGVGARKNVFVIGATNRPDVLDPAVIRPGRLDQLIYIPLPDLKSRESIFKAALRKAPVAPDVNLAVLARSTNGFSGADITEICQRASKLAIREQIIKEEARLLRVEKGEVGEDEGKSDPKNMIITKEHFEFAMSKARKSVSEQDLVLFQNFKDKQKAGRGAAATNFKFETAGGAGSGGGVEGGGSAADDDDLY